MQEMSGPEAREFLAHNRFGVLGLADGGRAYAIPLFYGYDGRDLYFQVRPGLKQRFAVATEEACFTIVRVMNDDAWASVQVFGPLDRMQKDLSAMHALMTVPLPPDWGETPRGEPARGGPEHALYRLEARRIAGRYSENAPPTPEEREIAFGGM